MDLLDASYLGLSATAGGVARALRRGLPAGWRLRLEARPPEGLPKGAWIWVHAVSVGELLVAEGLVLRLRDLGHRLHLSTGTLGGHDLLHRRLGLWDGGRGQVSGGGFPFDDPAGLRPWLAAAPALFLALETELWPGLMAGLEAAGIPSALVNARLTERTLRNPFAGAAARRFGLVAARDAESAEGFRSLGAPAVVLAGNLKADLPPPPPLHAGWEGLAEAWAGDPILVAGNTLEGEEVRVLETWRSLRSRWPTLRLILAPRQPRRFEAVAGLLAGESFRRASGEWPAQAGGWAGVDILLADTLGELSRIYALGTVALVGGGWGGEGGHNPLEPLRWGLPTLLGPGFRNFEDLVVPLLGRARLTVVDEDGLEDAVAGYLEGSPLRGPGEPDPALAALMGATDRTLALLRPLLPAPPPFA